MRECIILAGGKGTRLKSAVSKLPKCMAPINGKPFLYYLLSSLQQNNFSRIILGLGYQHKSVLSWLKKSDFGLMTHTVIEKEPLGTGGALKLALNECESDLVCALNGDTLFDINFDKFYDSHYKSNCNCSIALKPLKNFDRYGSVSVDRNSRIVSFNEKKKTKSGLINGGIYLLKPTILTKYPSNEMFSFETDYLHKNAINKIINSYTDDSYFIDIGIPEDYKRANIDFKSF